MELHDLWAGKFRSLPRSHRSLQPDVFRRSNASPPDVHCRPDGFQLWWPGRAREGPVPSHGGRAWAWNQAKDGALRLYGSFAWPIRETRGGIWFHQSHAFGARATGTLSSRRPDGVMAVEPANASSCLLFSGALA
jgi:hypothetical protein